MAHSIEELERLEKELEARMGSTDALDRVKAMTQSRDVKEQSSRPINRSTRGQWQSQSMGGISPPRRRR